MYDFTRQPVSVRPKLEARYVDGTRQEFEIDAHQYRIVFSLDTGRGHVITELRVGDENALVGNGIAFTLTKQDGRRFSTSHARNPSRVNLYRRGPYFCEVHWLDVQLADERGNAAPVKGELIFHAYPEKVHVSTVWHVEESLEIQSAQVVLEAARLFPGDTDRKMPVSGTPLGSTQFAYLDRLYLLWPAPNPGATFHSEVLGDRLVVNQDLAPGAWKAGSKRALHFELLPASNAEEWLDAERNPLAATHFSAGAGNVLGYDPVRGHYTVSTHNDGGFQEHFYHHPNRYETARFDVDNDETPRKIYICHETRTGAKGSVECGVLLDEDGDLLPVTVQISKNFSGEKEEPFYNPGDPSFSETYFPLQLAGGERRGLTSCHLYQNWGNHPLKQFSSLGAWMDYFHSSTGVTETTCYVPFKFGGLPGIDIADLRAMSQPFWPGQPQHDNVAGHSMLRYKDAKAWRYLEYLGTEYRSTGPNWMDIGIRYRSADGSILASLDTFELPQTDELRNFMHLRYEAVEPVTVTDARRNFRLLNISSEVQRLRHKEAMYLGHDGEAATVRVRSDGKFTLEGVPLADEYPFAAIYGDRRGGNAYVVRRFSSSIGGQAIGPAVSLFGTKKGDTVLMLVPDADEIEMQPGDYFDIELFIIPFGAVDNADAAVRGRVDFGANAPRIVDIIKGGKISDFPSRVRAAEGEAEFVISGGRNIIPVIVTGLPSYRNPRLMRKESGGWVAVEHERRGGDGYQVFPEPGGTFGAVFLVSSDGSPQTLRATAGDTVPPEPKITVRSHKNEPNSLFHAAAIQAEWMDKPVVLRFPETLGTDFGMMFIDHVRDDMPPKTDLPALCKEWSESEGGSAWFEWNLPDSLVGGGRLSPGTDEVDLEFWVINRNDKATDVHTQFCLTTGGSEFEDHDLTRSFVRVDGKWQRMCDADRGAGKFELCHYPVVGGPDLSWARNNPDGWGASRDHADAGLLAVASRDGRHLLSIAWRNPSGLLSNAFIPCIHADPTWPRCPAGRAVHLRGKLYLIEGTLDDLDARWRRDFGTLERE